MNRYICILVILLTIFGSCSKDESVEIELPKNTVDHSWAPLTRTTSNITLAEEDNLSFQSNSVELDFYRNTAYTCGFSGNYTFLVVEPVNNPGAEAPLWVYLHGGGAGYFDENEQYIIGVSPVNGSPHNPNNHNTEKTIEDLRDGQLIHNTHTNSGQIESSTLTRRIDGRLSRINCFYE